MDSEKRKNRPIPKGRARKQDNASREARATDRPETDQPSVGLRPDLESLRRETQERERIEAALRQSEREYRHLVESAHDAILIFRPEDEVVLEVNQKACELYGFGRSEFIGMSLEKITHDVPRGKVQIQATLDQGFYHHFESVHYRKDGSEMFVEINGSRVKYQGRWAIQSINRDITERKRTEEALREAKETFETLLKATPEAVTVTDLEGNITYASPQSAALHGYASPEEMVGRKSFQLIPPEEHGKAREGIQKLLRGESLVKEIFTGIKKDGSRHTIEINTAVLRDAQGTPKAFITSGLDITERKRAEEALRRKEEDYRTLAENSPDLIARFDRQLRHTYVNPAAARAGRFSASEYIGKTIPESGVPEPTAGRWEQYIRQVLETGQPLEVVDAFPTPDGLRYFNTRFIPELAPEGSVQSVMTIARDITERKRMEEALQFTRVSLDTSTDEVVCVDREARYIDVNHAFCRCTGYTREELLSMTVHDIDPDYQAEMWSEFWERLKRAGSLTFESRHRTKDGRVFPVEIVATFFEYEGKEYHSAFARDITERKRIEKALQESEEHFRALTENSLDVVIVVDKKGIITYVSPSIERVMGYKPEELIGESGFNFIALADLPKAVIDFGKAVLITDSIVPNAFRVRHKDGSERILEGVGRSLFDNPAVAGFVMNVRDVTERKRAVEALQESEEKYRLVVEHASDAILVAQDGMMKFVNPKVQEITGFSEGELTSRPFPEFIHPEDRAMVVERHQKRLQGKPVPPVYPFRIVTKAGEDCWVEISAVVISWKGKPATLNFLTDITERRKAEEALHTSEAQLSNALKMTRAGHWEYDVGSDTFTFNDNFYRIFRTTAEKVGGYKMSSADYARRFCHPDDAAMVGQEVRTAIEATDPNFDRQLEHRILYADGEVGHITVRFFIVKDEQGRTVRTYGVNQDITERKRAEEALQESEAHYRLLAENVTDVIWTLDLTLRFTYFSPSVRRQRGYSVEEAKGLSLKETLTPASFEKAMQAFSEEMALEGSGRSDPNRSRTLELENLCKDGSAIWTEVTTTFLRDQTGRPVGILGVTRDISGRRKAEEALRESEAMSRAVLDHSPVGISIRDQAGALLQVNEAWKKIWAISEAEIQENEKWSAGRSWKERCPYLGESGQDLDRLFTPEGGVSILFLPELEIPEPRPGAAQWISMYLYALRNQEGRVEKVVTLTQDISERRKAEEALRKSEAKYRELVENANSIILRRDSEGRITFFNEFAQRFFGFREEEILGRNVVGTIVPEKESSGRDLAQMIRDISRHPERYATNENENMLRSGERVWVAWTNKPVLDPDGKLAEILCIGNNITGRKRAEEKLAESEVKYRTLVEGMSEAVMQVDNDDRVLFVNPQFCQMIGYGEDELLGRVGYEIYFDPEEQELIRRKNRLRLEKASDAYETRMRKKNGEEVLVRISGSPVTDARGNVAGSIGVITDITERKLLEAEFLQAQKMEALGRLAGGVAHDFNNLLTSIMGYSDLLAKKLAEDDPSGPLRRYADNILSSANRAANLTQQLLSLSRRHAFQMQVLDLNGVVAEVERILRGLIGEDIELTIHPEGALGRVKADPVQIEQVLMNLVINARDAMPGGGKLSIETKNVVLDKSYARRRREVAPGPYVMIAVSDTGHGMDAEVQSHLFEPFFTTKDKGKGTGLGLSTAYSIVKQTGGHIVVESAPGKGSAFKIYLPRTEEPPAPLPSSQPNPVEAELPRGVETVLLAEDEEVVRSLAREILRSAGYTVLEAGDGEEALKVAGSHPGPIHLLLTDVIMPRLGGPELARRLQPLRPDMKVLFMSGYTDGDISSYGGLGLEPSLLQKPFQPIALARRVREVLEGP